MSSLLIDENPILVLPTLAAKIGLNESIVLQQVHYWLVNNQKNNHKAKVDHFADDRWWTWNTLEEWRDQFSWMSLSTVKRTISKLENDGFLLSKRPWAKDYKQTKWYTIDYDRLAELETLIKQEEKHKSRESGAVKKRASNLTKTDSVKMTLSCGSKANEKQGQIDTISTETPIKDFSTETSEINQYTKHFQEKVYFSGEESEFFKEDSLTKSQESRSHPSQQSKPTPNESTVRDSEIKNPNPLPPSPQVETVPRPTKGKSKKLDSALTEDDDGWLVAPTKGCYKLAGIIALRRMQYAIASEFVNESYTFTFEEDILEVDFKGEHLTWQEFEKEHPIGKLRNLALYDPDASRYFGVDWWNESLNQYFLDAVDFCNEYDEDAIAISRSQPASVLFDDIGLYDD